MRVRAQVKGKKESVNGQGKKLEYAQEWRVRMHWAFGSVLICT